MNNSFGEFARENITCKELGRRLKDSGVPAQLANRLCGRTRHRPGTSLRLPGRQWSRSRG